MDIAIIGYGKMGKAIEKVAVDRGHSIREIIDVDNARDLRSIEPGTVDVCIEFSGPDAAYENVATCLNLDLPVVSGSTGWLEKFPAVQQLCMERKGTILWASNFSIGANLFFELNKWLAAKMNNHPGYSVSIHEVHHTDKKDIPSGTSITLAEDIMSAHKQYKGWQTGDQQQENKLAIRSERVSEVPGTHTIGYHSPTDHIEIKHLAKSREGFAMGAVLVAEWIRDKNGVLTMADFLKT